MKKIFKLNRFFPPEGGRKNIRTILTLFFLSILFLSLTKLIPLQESSPLKKEMVRASQIMVQAMNTIKECRENQGIPLQPQKDLNKTGIIGWKNSSITTSIGHLEAKRTTTNPNFAGLTVYLLQKAGVKEGDTIAVGASSSFPALIVATLAAAEEMGVGALLVCSLGASQWGANIPQFHWLRMNQCLLNKGIIKTKPVAVSLGGDTDTGKDMEPPGRTLLLKDIKESGLPFLYVPDLEENVKKRMNSYKKNAGCKKIKAFINIGGCWANLGTDSRILRLKPGLVKISDIPPPERRGMVYEMASQNIPVVHFLYIRGLIQRYGLPWDPVPLPSPGEGKIYGLVTQKKNTFYVFSFLYLASIILILAFRKRIR